jgi:O-antigen/teichoic acid export membrane protein/SAM-dependent methyltransferase
MDSPDKDSLPDPLDGSPSFSDPANLSTPEDMSPVLSLERRIRLMQNSVVNYSGILVAGILGLVLVPILIKGLGEESYGLWIAAAAVTGFPGIFDFGIDYAVKREVAARKSTSSEQTTRFVVTAGYFYVALGIVGGLIVASLGGVFADRLHLSAANRGIALYVFGLVGLGFFADQLLVYATAVLAGFERFGTANLISIIGSLFRAAGIIALVWAGAKVLPVVAWQAVLGTVVAFTALGIIAQIEPRYRLRWDSLDLSALRPHLPFSLTSMMASLAGQFLWDLAPILLGLMRGSAAIVPYYVGEKIPMAASFFSWRMAETLFPAASESERARDSSRPGEILRLGTRWIVLLFLPICIALWVLTPNILHAWVGESQPDVVRVMRLLTIAVLVEGLGAAATHVLWGHGKVRRIFWVYTVMGGVNLALSIWLLGWIGMVGLAWSLSIVLSAGAIGFLGAAQEVCGIKILPFVRYAMSGLWLPALVGVTAAYGLALSFEPSRWTGVIGVFLAAGTAYGITLVLSGLREEERLILREVLGLPGTAAHAEGRGLWCGLCRIGFLRSGAHGAILLRRLLTESLTARQEHFNRWFARSHDPWEYSGPAEQARFRHATAILDALGEGRRFLRAIEVGCALGHFTEHLASRCENLLAVDFSPVVLAQARERCQNLEHVRFLEWDLFQDPAPGVFDLVVAMAVLEGYARPSSIRAGLEKIVSLLGPNGILFMSMTRDKVAEKAWWGRWFFPGPDWTNRLLQKHPLLRVVRVEQGDFYVFTILRKVQ